MQNSEFGDMTLKEKWLVCLQYKKWIFFVTFAAFASALVFVLTMKTKWEATSVVQVGQLGLAEQILQNQSFIFIEPPVQAQHRVMSSSFANQVRSKFNATENPPSFPQVKVNAMKGTDSLVEIKVQSFSADQAKQVAQATVDELLAEHLKIFKPHFETLEIQYKRVKQSIETLQPLVELMQKKSVGFESKSSSDLLLYFTLVQTKIIHLSDLERKKFSLELQLDPVRTFSSKQVGETQIAALSNRKALILISTILIGFFTAIGTAFLHRSLQ